MTQTHARSPLRKLPKVHTDLAPPQGMPAQPISRVLWLPRSYLHSNSYNPNTVAPPELTLLKMSLLADGWCVEASTPVLCADLVWRPAGTLEPGDRLIAFDEDSIGPLTSGARKFRTADVLSNGVQEDLLWRVVTDCGSVLVNAEHPWLARRPHGETARSLGWIPTKHLQLDDQLVHLLDPWESDRSYDAGWLAGFLDGEGSFAQNQAVGHSPLHRLAAYQRPGPTADRMIREVMSRVHASVNVHVHHAKEWYDQVQIRVDRLQDVLQLLGTVRPERLIQAGGEFWAGVSTALPGNSRATVLSVEAEGRGTMATLATSTRTYIAAGFAMHNTQPIVVRKDAEIVDGWHRWGVSADDQVAEMTEGYVPVVYLRPDAPLEHQMASTIRHNRARGVHGVRPMAAIVRELIDQLGMTPERMVHELGMEREEVDRLYTSAGMPTRTGDSTFTKGWTPGA